jgi:hypothetical protein
MVSEREAFDVMAALVARVSMKRECGERPGALRYLSGLQKRAKALWVELATERDLRRIRGA